MPEILDYLKRYHPVEEFKLCDPGRARDLVYPKSEDEEDDRLVDLVEKNILHLYHREYRIGSMPLIWPPEIEEEIEETDGGGGPSHERLKFESVWLGNVHWGAQLWYFEDEYAPQSPFKYDAKLGNGLFVEVGGYGEGSRDKPYRVFDLRDISYTQNEQKWGRSRSYEGRVSKLMIIPYPDGSKEITMGEIIDVYYLERGGRYYDTPVIGDE